MDTVLLTQLLRSVAAGTTSPEDALRDLRDLPFAATADGAARVDLHRHLRRGVPEAVFGLGKTTAQLCSIAETYVAHRHPLLVTRIDEEKGAALRRAVPAGSWHPVARAFTWAPGDVEDAGRGHVLVVAAGTSDLPVAEECAVSLVHFGHRVERLTDVGVAGLQRILAERHRLQDPEVIVVVAGMEGALPTVVGGLTSRPVIAVPTSVGYGANLGGVAALLGMLNSCAAGVTVVNIDNGFGAAVAAALINRRRDIPAGGGAAPGRG